MEKIINILSQQLQDLIFKIESLDEEIIFDQSEPLYGSSIADNVIHIWSYLHCLFTKKGVFQKKVSFVKRVRKQESNIQNKKDLVRSLTYIQVLITNLLNDSSLSSLRVMVTRHVDGVNISTETTAKELLMFCIMHHDHHVASMNFIAGHLEQSKKIRNYIPIKNL